MTKQFAAPYRPSAAETRAEWEGKPNPHKRRETSGEKAAKAARAKLNRGLFGRLFK